MAASIQDLRDLFDRYGWTFHEKDKQTLLAGFKGESNDFIIGARLADDWLKLTIPDYLPAIPSERLPQVYRYLLELNSRVAFIRFALDSENTVIVMADLPGVKNLDYDLFAMAIDLLSFYADDVYPHLCKLITEPEITNEDKN